MNLVNEIRDLFASSVNGKAIPILSLEKEYPAWVLRFDDRYGVAIEINLEIQISERFSNVRYHTEELYIGDEKKNLLLLTSSIETLRNEFSNFCALFVQPGPYGNERKYIIKQPHDWWLKWKELLGNTYYDKAVYSVLGELIVYLYLLSNDKNPKWTGPKRGSVDFESHTCDIEVKSTINRYDSIITINSQFQLINNKKLQLIFCRFEESVNGVCVDDVFDKLYELGTNPEELNRILTNLGLEKNSLDRKKKYKVLELRKYNIDNEFPIITANSFKESKIPDNIIQLTYKVDLSGINYTTIPQKFIGL